MNDHIIKKSYSVTAGGERTAVEVRVVSEHGKYSYELSHFPKAAGQEMPMFWVPRLWDDTEFALEDAVKTIVRFDKPGTSWVASRNWLHDSLD